MPDPTPDSTPDSTLGSSASSPATYGDYALIDSGQFSKLERFGRVVLERPAAAAIWPQRLPTNIWHEAVATYHRDRSGGGDWTVRDRLAESWTIETGGLKLLTKPTGFGHVGLFAEQIPFWRWIRHQCSVRTLEVLNLFAYTGGSTLAAAQGKARVTHCDASRGIVQWARENADLCDLTDAPIRWIVDDAGKFVRREVKRERAYDAIILDPPSFGRGNKGEVWKFERDLLPLLEACGELLSDKASFFLLSAHTPGVSGLALRQLVLDTIGRRAGSTDCGEMWITPEHDGPLLPSGNWAAWWADGSGPELDTLP